MREIGSGAPGPHMVVVDAAGQVAWGHDHPQRHRWFATTSRRGARPVAACWEGQTEGSRSHPMARALWVGANQAGKVYRLDPATLEVEAEVASGPVPIRVAAHPGGKWVVSSNFGEGGLSVIDTG